MKIGPVYLCQGCTIIFSTFVITLLFFILTGISFDPISWMTVGILLAIMPIIVELLKIRNRGIKRLSRLLTGMGLGTLAWGLLFIPDLLVRITGMIVTVIAYQGFKWGRKKGRERDRCIDCPDFIQGKICPGLEDKAKAMREYSDYATEIFSDRLRRKATAQYYIDKDD